MHWVLQTNIFAEEGFETLMAAIKRFDLKYTLVKVVPFIGDLEAVEGELPPDGANAIVMGSYSLARVAKQRNWTPGAFLDNLDFEVQRRHWGDRMLNQDAIIFRFEDVDDAVLAASGWSEEETKQPFFMRPVHDTKAFTGEVIDWPNYFQWRDALRRLPETNDPVNDPLGVNVLTLDTPVMVCRKKEIWSETRFWIVDGWAVTWSGYKMGTIKRYQALEAVETFMRGYAMDCAAVWSPNDAYVLDISNGPDGPRIVEVNNLNSAGWYKGDLQKLVMALEERFS
jgi:hypothetical protein